MTNSHLTFGASLTRDGARFTLWAPAAEAVILDVESGPASGSYTMRSHADGWHDTEVPHARGGDRYRFVLPDGARLPDPASRFNPDDVHGASEVVDPHHDWRHPDWRGRPWSEAVVYELHVGTFTAAGTYAAAQDRLGELAELGITAIELMPLADFPGKRNWGYDGVLMFAPDASYGTPKALREFIDAAHGHGLMVLLDVVYNHFGPEGNYLPAYCPQFFNPEHQTPWGAAINFDGDNSRNVRDFFVQNALYWIEEFRFDGLRMDAVHAINDTSPVFIIEEIIAAVRSGPGANRHVHIILENEENRASLLERSNGRPTKATAQWNDDIHHAVHVLSTGETEGYYADYQAQPLQLFGRALAEGFIFQGQASTFLNGKHRGEQSAHLPGLAFVSFLQTHDQIGNRALGERIHALGEWTLLRAARACVLLSPHVPMFFMGEEFASTTPFQFFCDFGPELARAVTEGRRKEFSHFGGFTGEQGENAVPDPSDESTFLASKLDWDERLREPHADWLAEAKLLLGLRRERLAPLLDTPYQGGKFDATADGTLHVEWKFAGPEGVERCWRLLAHFGAGPSAPVALPRGTTVYSAGVRPSSPGKLMLDRGAVHCCFQESAHG
ncbi:MAG: treZ [Variovorax sp.]|nr:treZ [Variovorax sp.]